MREAQMEDYNKLADISLSMDNDPGYVKTDSLIENGVLRHGTHALIETPGTVTNDYSYMQEKHNILWYRGTEHVVSENPFLNWLSKKKWPLSEQLNLHMLNYQEVQSSKYS